MAGSSNFKVFNENALNMETDATYTSDTARQNGVTAGVASSSLHNKLYRQVSIMATAIGQFIANTNNNASDTNVATLVSAMTAAIASKNDLNTWALNKPVADTGTANAYKISTGYSYTAYYTGMIIKFTAANANIGASVVNVDTIGNISLVKGSSTALVSGDITANQVIVAIYDGTNFEIISDYSSSITNLNNALTTHMADDTSHVYYAVATGTNTYVITTTPAPIAYVDGMAVCVKFTNASTGASTLNWNSLGAKTILDSNGSAIASGTFKAGYPYTMRYSTTTGSFMLQAKGGGTAGAAQILNSYTATTDIGLVAGTMASNSAPTATITTQGGTAVIPAGYNPGGTVTANISNLIASNIISGTTVGGITGTYSNIKSIQRGSVITAAASTSVTISAVDLTKAVIRISYWASGSCGAYLKNILVNATFTNATTINFATYAFQSAVNIEWEVIEFNNVKSIQRGTVSSTTTTTTVNVSSVNTSKSFCIFSERLNTNDSYTTQSAASCKLVSSTSLQFSINNYYSANYMEYTWTLIEFN